VRTEAGTRKAIQKGIQRAKSYRLESEREVLTYINCMHLYGDDFDRDPKCAWAAQILTNNELPPPVKAETLVHEARRRNGSAPG
jgi:hypothetical protein